MQHIIDRFISYVTVDTESDPNSDTTPSTAKQWDLANKLVEELKTIGLEDVTIDDNAYIMATLPSNVAHDVPVIGFVSHFDTTPDFTGANIKPQIVANYDGGDIILNKEQNIVLSPNYFKDLLQYKGQTIITTDGTTLLGADDKAGITEIVTAMEYLIQHPEIKHGKIRIGFTPDEEIGRGAHKFDVAKFGADWAYTMDGSQIGELEYENFNAAGAKVTFKGKSVHPGYAKGKMINSMLIANKFISKLPKEEVPEHTSGYEGFFHVTGITGSIEETVVQLIIRDHDKKRFEKRKKLVKKTADKINKKFEKQFGGNIATAEIKDQYYNMKEKVEPVFHIVDIAEQAMKELDIKPIIKPIRGGTDGCQLSYMGLPCPNIFAGGHNFHGKYEYVPVESMQKAVDVIVRIAELTAKEINYGAAEKTWNKEHLWPEGLDTLKAIINKTGLVETTKWGGPIYTYNGKNVLAIGGFTNYFAIWFHKGVFLKDPAGVLINAQEGTTKSLRQWRFTDTSQIDEKLILQYISEAIEVEKAGLAIKPEPKQFPMPEILQKELDASPEMAAAFAKFSPYKQKEFLEFVGSAKRLETQIARMEKSRPMIVEGRGLNDKYR